VIPKVGELVTVVRTVSSFGTWGAQAGDVARVSSVSSTTVSLVWESHWRWPAGDPERCLVVEVRRPTPDELERYHQSSLAALGDKL